MRLRYILLLLSPALLLANGDGGGETDIVPRAINFVIFASILYYLLADHAKKAYKDRIAGIADRLDSIQTKVKESVTAKQTAQAKVEEAKANAKTIVETSKKEAQLIMINSANSADAELHNMDKSFKDKTDVESRKMARDIVTHLLDDMFEKDSISIDKEELVKIVLKRVA